MRYRFSIVVLLVAVGGLLALLGVQWRFGLGSFARNPQEIELALGRRTVVGGGRAVLGFAAWEEALATFELACRDEVVRFELEADGASDEVCGVRAGLIEVLDGFEEGAPPRAWMQVWWEE